MSSSSPNFESLLHSNSTPASILVVTPQREEPLLSFGENFLDEICGGVRVSQFTILYGGKICQTLAEQLCVRSQLPVDAGGFDAPSVFVDGGNTFDLYQASNYASTLQLDRDAVLRGIEVSRAFTCYQLVNLIVEKLPELLCDENAKLVVIANLLDMFMDPEVDLKEAKDTVNFLSNFLATFSRENEVAIVAACPTNRDGRDPLLRQFLTSRAQVVLKAERTERCTVVTLEKHPVKPRALRTIYNDQMTRTSRVKNEELRQVLYPSCRIS